MLRLIDVAIAADGGAAIDAVLGSPAMTERRPPPSGERKSAYVMIRCEPEFTIALKCGRRASDVIIGGSGIRPRGRHYNFGRHGRRFWHLKARSSPLDAFISAAFHGDGRPAFYAARPRAMPRQRHASDDIRRQPPRAKAGANPRPSMRPGGDGHCRC